MGFFVGTVNGVPLMSKRPTYEELKQRVEELEKKAASRTEEQKTLRESEDKFKSLAEQSPNMIFINKGGRVVYVNKRCQEVMGYKKEEFYSPDFDFLTLVAPESMELVKSSFKRHMSGEEVESYEYSIITKHGERIDAIITTKLIDYEGERAILGIVTDITHRKRTEAALLESKELFEKTFRAHRDAIFILNAEIPPKIVDCNPAAAEMFGYSREEMLGRTTVFLHVSEEALRKFQKQQKLELSQQRIHRQF
jgi:PAS domain S-box-containing protein